MVKQVTAWRAEDGKVFDSEHNATAHDARCALASLNIFNEGTINAIIANVHAVEDAVKALASFLPREGTSNAVNG